MTAVHVVVPEGIDDPARPSGGNVYDRRLCEELTRSGWSVGEHEATAALAGVIAGVPDGRVVLVDGLVAVKHAHDLLGHADRLRIVVLLHMPFGERDEAQAVGLRDEDIGRRRRDQPVGEDESPVRNAGHDVCERGVRRRLVDVDGPTRRRESVGHATVVGVAAARPRRVVDAFGDDEVDVAHNSRS